MIVIYKAMRNILITALFIVFGAKLFAYNSVFRHFSVNEGLPSSEIYHIIQDSKGYLWVATNMGVSRYDGKEFKNFDTEDGLPVNTIFEVYEDETGRVWFVGFPFQLSYFVNGSIVPYKYNSILRTVAGKGKVPVKKSFRVDKDNNVFFSLINDNKIYKINARGEMGSIYNLSTKPHNTAVIKVGGQLLICSKGRHNEQTELNVDFFDKSKMFALGSSSKFSHGFYMVQLSKKGEVLYAQNDRLSHILPDGSCTTHVLKDRILWISTDNDGAIWVGFANGGVQKFGAGSLHQEPELTYLDSLSVTSVLQDSEGGKWFSTIEDGLFYQQTEGYYSISRSKLGGDYIKDVEFFDGKTYVGLMNKRFGIFENEKVKEISYFDQHLKPVNILHAYKDEVLWLVTDDYLYSYDKSHFHKHINNYSDEVSSVLKLSRFSFSIKNIYPISATEVLLAESNALSIFKDGKVVYNSFIDDNIELRIEAIAKGADSTYLLGTFNGLWTFCNSRFEYLGIESPLLKERITDIAVYNDRGDYILATKGSGIIVKTRDSILQISRLKGLSSNSVTSLLILGNTLWVGTNNGLNLIDLEELGKPSPHILVMKKEHGLISNEITQLKGNEAFVYIVTSAGVTIVDRAKYKPESYRPPIYISGLSIMKKDTSISDDYKLSYDHNFIIISYTGISFRDGGNLHYKYRLKGLSNEWVYTNNTEVEYAFLPPGNYQFEVLAINSDGEESPVSAAMQFVILPPFWKTWWFILLAILATATPLFFYISYRLRVIKKEHQLQNDLNWYRQQALTRQMDPHFVFNTLNSIQSYVIKNDRLASSQYLSKFARLMRLILNNSQNQAIPLSDEISALNLYMELESLRFQYKFEYSIETDASVDTENSYIPAFIIQPFIENAIWHGIMGLKTVGIININFVRDNGQLLCTVQDNGIGRVKSREMKVEGDIKRKSLGISLVQSRLKLLNDFYGVEMSFNFTDLYNDNATPAGTRVTINLPLIS